MEADTSNITAITIQPQGQATGCDHTCVLPKQPVYTDVSYQQHHCSEG